jgi:hypothetical protein
MNKLMRMLVIVLLTCTAISGQSGDELRRQYGNPISETFMVRPGISVTASYASDGRITELLISPRNLDHIKSRGVTLSPDAVKAVIDELVPRSERGKFLIGTFDHIICLPENDCAGTSENYQRVTIYYNAGAKGRVTYAVVQWKE